MMKTNQFDSYLSLPLKDTWNPNMSLVRHTSGNGTGKNLTIVVPSFGFERLLMLVMREQGRNSRGGITFHMVFQET